MKAGETGPSAAVIKLPAAIDRAAANDLLRALKEHQRSGASVSLDASGVESVGYLGVQVLLAAVAPPSAIAVRNPSGPFVGAFADYGLAWEHRPAEPAATRPNDVAPPEPAQAAADTSGAPARTRVLTIDDSKTMRDMLRLTLSSSGFEVLQAVDGQDGLDVLAREPVDVVITDINMPKLDGYGVLRHLRSDRAFDQVPILVLTTESDNEKKELARGLGATGFIIKPFDPSSLVEVIREVAVAA